MGITCDGDQSGAERFRFKSPDPHDRLESRIVALEPHDARELIYISARATGGSPLDVRKDKILVCTSGNSEKTGDQFPPVKPIDR